MFLSLKVIEMANKKHVSGCDWKVFVWMLIIIWSIAVFDILDNLTSIVLSVLIAIVFMFKKYIVEEQGKMCFFDDVVDFDIHEVYIQHFEKLRWETLFVFVLAIVGLRVADIYGYISYTSSMATVMIIGGMLFSFLPEIDEYMKYFSNTAVVRTCEDIELDLINSIYRSRAVFSGSILGIFLFSLSVRQITDPIHTMFVYVLLIGIIYYTYHSAINAKLDRLSNTILKRSPHRHRDGCGCSM